MKIDFSYFLNNNIRIRFRHASQDTAIFDPPPRFAMAYLPLIPKEILRLADEPFMAMLHEPVLAKCLKAGGFEELEERPTYYNIIHCCRDSDGWPTVLEVWLNLTALLRRKTDMPPPPPPPSTLGIKHGLPCDCPNGYPPEMPDGQFCFKEHFNLIEYLFVDCKEDPQKVIWDFQREFLDTPDHNGLGRLPTVKEVYAAMR